MSDGRSEPSFRKVNEFASSRGCRGGSEFGEAFGFESPLGGGADGVGAEGKGVVSGLNRSADDGAFLEFAGESEVTRGEAFPSDFVRFTPCGAVEHFDGGRVVGEGFAPLLEVVKEVEGEGGAFETMAYAEAGGDGVAGDPVANRLEEVGVAVPLAGALGKFAAEGEGDGEGATEAAASVGHERGEVFVFGY